jgi:hypothetical protein
VRKFLFVVLTSLAAMGAHAWEPSTADSQSDGASTQASYAEALVTVAPVPMPAIVTELASYSPQSTVRQAKTVKAAKVAQAKSMLSRTAREQIALANTATKADDRDRLDASDDEDDDPGIDDQDLHRSFSQPKVVKKPDLADDPVIDLPDHIKLRLLMARTKAVDAHILSQAGKASPNTADENLPEHVKLRLFLARALAVKAHTDKFGKA